MKANNPGKLFEAVDEPWRGAAVQSLFKHEDTAFANGADLIPAGTACHDMGTDLIVSDTCPRQEDELGIGGDDILMRGIG